MGSRHIRGPLVFNTHHIVLSGDYVIVNESLVIVNKPVGAATNITLPPSVTADGRREIRIVDGKGDASSNNITVTVAGTDTINGAATLVLAVNNAYVVIIDLGGGAWLSPVGLPAAKFSTINVTTGTLAAGKASGAEFTVLQSTNATPGNQAMRTPAQILADTPGLAVGASYVLRIVNTGAGSLTLTTDSGSGFTMTGTSFVVAQNAWKDFVVTINSGTTGTVQGVGYGTFS